MSAFFYDHRKAMPLGAFDSSNRSPSKMQRSTSEDSFMCRGESPVDATMVAANGIPIMERPDNDSPFAQWEAYIVKQTQNFDHPPATPRQPFAALPPRITWSDQIKRAAPQAQPLVYTKSRDRMATSPSPQASPLTRPLELLRSASSERFKSTPSPPRPNISSPYLSSSNSTLRSAPISPANVSQPLPYPTHEAMPLAVHAPKPVRGADAMLGPKPLPDESTLMVGTPQSESPSLPSLSFSPFSSDSSSGCFSADRRASNTSTSSGRAPGPSEVASYPVSALPGSQSTAPPSIASSYSVHSRRSSWASSVDVDPAVVRTPPLSHEGKDWQQQQVSFLQEFGIHHDSEESEAEDGPSSVPSLSQPIFQRMQADLPEEHQSASSSGRSLPPLDLSRLPREKEEVQKLRSKMASPLSLTKSFRKKSPKSPSTALPKSADGMLRRGSASSHDSRSRSSSEQSSSVHEMQPTPETVEEPPRSPSESTVGPSEPATPVASTVALPSPEREETPSILSASSFTSNGRVKAAAKRARSASNAGAAPTLDPLLARGSTRLRSASILSNESSTSGRRGSRRSARNRITDGMPAFGDFASTLPASALAQLNAGTTLLEQRRLSIRSISSDGSSIDDHSNSSSLNKVAGSDDSLVPPRPVAVKGVLRKRQPSEDSHLTSHKKEVSFELPPSDSGVKFDGIDSVSEEVELEHEQKQREMLKLPPLKLQSNGVSVEEGARGGANQDDLEIASYLATFGKDVSSVRSTELLETFAGAASQEWPRREDWNSMPAYLMAYATAVVSAYNDDGAALVYTAPRGQSVDSVTVSPLMQPVLRSLHDVVSWQRPAVSALATAAYFYSWNKGSVLPLILGGSAALFVSQGMRDASSDKDDADKKMAAVLLGSAETRQRFKNLLLSRAPRASVRCTATFLGLLLCAMFFPSVSVLGVAGLFAGLALFAWVPIVLQQPGWAPAALKESTPLEALLYDVPSDAQYAIMLMRKRACNGDQIVHTTADAPHISPAIFENKLAFEDLKTTSNVLDGAHAASFEGNQGHFFVLPTRVLFRTSMSANFADQLASPHASTGGRVLFEARTDKVTLLTKTAAQNGLVIGLRNGTRHTLDRVENRDLAFNKLLAIAPQKWTSV